MGLKNKQWLIFYLKLAQELHKSLEEIYALPAKEILLWREYFSIYPFTQEREDMRIAQLSYILSRVNGGKATIDKFMPKYDDRPDEDANKSIEQQNKELADFIEKYTLLKGK